MAEVDIDNVKAMIRLLDDPEFYGLAGGGGADRVLAQALHCADGALSLTLMPSGLRC